AALAGVRNRPRRRSGRRFHVRTSHLRIRRLGVRIPPGAPSRRRGVNAATVLPFPSRPEPGRDWPMEHLKGETDSQYHWYMAPLPFDESLADVLAAWQRHGQAAGHSDRTITSRAYTIK